MTRILQVLACLERGGTEAFVMNQYRQIDRSQVQFDFFVFREKDYPYLEEIRSLGGKVIFGVPPKSTQLPKFFRIAEHVMREGGYAAVHSHVNLTNAWVMLAARRAGVPIRVSHSHDTIGRGGLILKRAYRDIELKILKSNANVYLACGQAAGEYLYGAEFFQHRGKVIQNGIDLDKFLRTSDSEAEAARKSFSLPNDCDLLIGNISRFEPKKNQLFILDVFKELLNRHPKACLVLGGPDGGMLKETMQKAEQLSIDSRVRFIGIRNDIPACLKAFDLILFPSQFEGLPIMLLEAQASGKFCAVSSAVSKEADLGIGKLSFYDLQSTPALWAEHILKEWNLVDVSENQIRTAFQKRGYDVRQSSRELMKIYCNET